MGGNNTRHALRCHLGLVVQWYSGRRHSTHLLSVRAESVSTQLLYLSGTEMKDIEDEGGGEGA